MKTANICRIPYFKSRLLPVISKSELASGHPASRAGRGRLRGWRSLASFACGLVVALFLVAGGASAQTTGFNQTTAGPFDYNTTSNWVGGTINGIWDSSLTLAASQTVTFAADTSLTTGLTFNYAGNFDETLKATGSNHLMTLGGDIKVNTSVARTITIGSTTATQNLNVDLGGVARTFNVAGVFGTQRTLTFANNVSDGSLTLTGGGIVNLNSANSLSALTLQGVMFAHSNLAGDTSISGALTIAGGSGGAGFITLSSGASTHASITANSLARTNGGVAFFRGATLGTAAPGTNNVNNITFATSLVPQLIGGGATTSGAHNISILPWAAGDTSTTGVGATTTSFVTYDATNGIRLLTASEYDTTITDGASTTNNVQLTNGSTTTINGNTTINSLITASGATATVLNGSGTLSITSGAVFLGAGNGAPNVTTTLNFGSAQGNIGTGSGKGGTFGSAVQGSGGLVLYQATTGNLTSSNGSALSYSGSAANSTYTGDTYIIGRATVTVNNFLPNGTRTGDVYVNGLLEANNSITINGLNGSGQVYRSVSGSGTLTLGDNNANGTFSGVIASTNGPLSLTKIGSGTQTFSGASTYTGATSIKAGTLIVSGSLSASGAVTVGDSANLSTVATLAGSGLVGNVTVGAAANNTGATLYPGAGSGVSTLTTGTLTFLNGSAHLAIQLGQTSSGNPIPGINNDSVTTTGNVTFNGADLSLSLGSGFNLSGDNLYFIINNTSSQLGGLANLGQLSFGGTALGQDATFNYGGQQFQISYTADYLSRTFDGAGNDVAIQAVAVPEPGTWAMIVGGLGVLKFWQRSRARRMK